jgi:hypothetical protein
MIELRVEIPCIYSGENLTCAHPRCQANPGGKRLIPHAAIAGRKRLGGG